MNVLKERPALDEHDFQTVRQVYSEAQQWARHYEMLIVNMNVMLISSGVILLGLGIGESATRRGGLIVIVACALALIGVLLTWTLFRLYGSCIRRMARVENLLNCFDGERFNRIDAAGSLLPIELARLPIPLPASVKFFMSLHGVFLCIFGALASGLLLP
jgi:hypothetical protein